MGLPDGNNAISGKEYTAYYVDCYINRTMMVRKCNDGIFDPDLRICTKEINSGLLMLLIWIFLFPQPETVYVLCLDTNISSDYL